MIHGLSCAQCKASITADGVSCAACSAPHHWPCYAGAGHCASCQAAKPPVPFGVAPAPRGGRWVPLVVGLATVSIVGALATTWMVLGARPVPPPPPPPPPVARPPASTISSMLLSQQELRAKFGLHKSLARTEPGADTRLAKHPGRLSGFLNTLVVANVPERVDLTGTPSTLAFVQAEVRLGGTQPKPVVIKFEARVGGQWVALSEEPAPPSGPRWYRLESKQAFDGVRISHASPGQLKLHTFVALLARPAGEVRAAAKAATVKALDGASAVLASAGGHELKVPTELLAFGRAIGNAAVSAPNGSLVARLSREGQVNVFDPRSGMSQSWGTDISTIHAARQAQWLMKGQDDATDWVNGIAAWTLLSRWQPPRLREMVYSTALEASAVLNHDGTCTVYRPQSGRGLPVIDFDDVTDLAEAVEFARSSKMLPYTPRRQRAQMRTGALGVPAPLAPDQYTRSQTELIRWLEQDVLAAFRKLAPAAQKVAVGDTVWIGWRNAHTNWGYQGTLQVTMLDRDTVLCRPAERGSPHLSMAEIEVARDFLPERPEPSVGQTIWLDPEAGR